MIDHSGTTESSEHGPLGSTSRSGLKLRLLYLLWQYCNEEWRCLMDQNPIAKAVAGSSRPLLAGLLSNLLQKICGILVPGCPLALLSFLPQYCWLPSFKWSSLDYLTLLIIWMVLRRNTIQINKDGEERRYLGKCVCRSLCGAISSPSAHENNI